MKVNERKYTGQTNRQTLYAIKLVKLFII